LINKWILDTDGTYRYARLSLRSGRSSSSIRALLTTWPYWSLYTLFSRWALRTKQKIITICIYNQPLPKKLRQLLLIYLRSWFSRVANGSRWSWWPLQKTTKSAKRKGENDSFRECQFSKRQCAWIVKHHSSSQSFSIVTLW